MGRIKLPCILRCAKTGSGQLHVQAMARSRFLFAIVCGGSMSQNQAFVLQQKNAYATLQRAVVLSINPSL